MPCAEPSELARSRLRWRARRGLLENDLILNRFLDTCEAHLSEAEVRALTRLLDMGDHELLDIFLGRASLAEPYDDPDTRRLIEQIKAL